MGINVSHGSNQRGEERRSALTIANLGKHLAHVLPSRDWAVLAPYFDGRFSGEAHIPPATAREMAQALNQAVGHRLMPAEWAAEARLFANAAHRAATAGQSWHWH